MISNTEQGSITAIVSSATCGDLKRLISLAYVVTRCVTSLFLKISVPYFNLVRPIEKIIILPNIKLGAGCDILPSPNHYSLFFSSWLSVHAQVWCYELKDLPGEGNFGPLRALVFG